MKIYALLINTKLYNVPDRKKGTLLYQGSLYMGTHKTLRGAVKDAESLGFRMGRLEITKIPGNVTSYSSYINESGCVDEWAEIVENDFLD